MPALPDAGDGGDRGGRSGPGPEAVRLFSPGALTGVEVLEADNSGRLWKYCHERYAVCTSLAGYHCGEGHWRGYGEVLYRRRTCRIAPGSIFLIEPGETHVTTSATGPATFRVLMLDRYVMEQMWREAGGHGTPHFATVIDTCRGPFERFKRIHTGLHRRLPRLEQQSRLVECVSSLFESCMEERLLTGDWSMQRAVHLVRQYLEENFAKDVSLEDLERVTNLTRFYLEHAFRRAMGMPIHQYLVTVRVSRAREQIRRGLPLKSIDVGFYDQAHFTHEFKRILGVTPGQFREAVLAPTGSGPSSGEGPT